jgi:MazG family protein
MCSNRFAERALVGIRQEALEGMAGHDDKVEAPAEAQAAAIRLHPGDGTASCALACHIEHRAGRIDAPHLARAAECGRKKPRAAAEVEDAPCLPRHGEAVARVVAPAVLRVVELHETGIFEELVLHHLAVADLRQIGYSPPMSQNPADMDPRKIETLRAIMKALRTPVTGCPWDLEQNFETIAPYTIEEAYEVADAIQKGSRAELCEELGDLLLQSIYHAQMADEEGSFSFDDVVEAVNRKMIRRHPHVFGDDEARSATLAKGFWEDRKAEERKGQPQQPTLAGIPLALPGLTRALKLQAKAAKVGFDCPSVDNVYDKIAEEVAEFRAAPEDNKAEEFGDLLFAMANVARHLGIDPEAALRGTNAKFERRFGHVEARLREMGKEPKQSTLEEMDGLWDEAKRLGK